MSTRCNIIIQHEHDKLFFYRHSDGYPSVTLKDLKAFVKNYSKEKYRLNVGQSAGHLIVRGHKEYKRESRKLAKFYKSSGLKGYSGNDWKVGAYEPTTDIHGDIEFLYTIDLANRVLTCKDVYANRQLEAIKF